MISSAFGTSIPGDKESDFGVLNSQNLLRITELEGVGISLRAAVQARMVLALAEGPGLVCTGVGS